MGAKSLLQCREKVISFCRNMRVKLRVGTKKKGDNQKGGDLKKVIDPSLPSLREGCLPAGAEKAPLCRRG